MYESQTHSKYYRSLEKRFGALFREEKLLQQIYSKHFKKYYKGKPTKHYAKILKELEKANNIDYNEFLFETYNI